jgi:cell division protein FtsB
VAALSLAVVAGLAVLPARTWLTQREEISEARTELADIEAELVELRAELELLQTDAEIERLARADFDLVYPGEESYRIVPPEGDD